MVVADITTVVDTIVVMVVETTQVETTEVEATEVETTVIVEATEVETTVVVEATVVEATVVEAPLVQVMAVEAMVMEAVMEAVRADGLVNKAVVGLTIIKSTLEIPTFHQVKEPVSAQNTLSATTMAIAGNCQLKSVNHTFILTKSKFYSF